MTLMQAYALGAALGAADRAGLLQAVAASPCTARELAEARGLDPTAVALVLEVLCTQGLLERADDRYRATPVVRAELAGPGSRPGRSVGLWQHVDELLRSARTVEPMDGTEHRGRAYATTTPALGHMFAGPAARLAERLAELLGDATQPQILDVGAGSGVWSLSVAERVNGATVVGLDLPNVLPAFRAGAEAKGLAARVEVIEGDFHAVDLPSGRFDLCVAANVLHLERPDAAAALLRRLAGALGPTGALVIVDAISDGSPEAERSRAAYALHLAMRIPGGHPHHGAQLSSWLRGAGLARVEHVDLSAGFLSCMGALVARR